MSLYNTNQIRVKLDNITELKNYTMSKSTNKQITLNYLNNNNIKYYKLFNTIISFPITSPQNEALHCPHTKLYYFDNILFPKSLTILIHKY